MSDAKWTPGPWCVDRTWPDSVHNSDGNVVVSARLIAAAPAILAKLARWFASGNPPTGHTTYDDSRTWCEVVNAYLARVEGREA